MLLWSYCLSVDSEAAVRISLDVGVSISLFRCNIIVTGMSKGYQYQDSLLIL